MSCVRARLNWVREREGRKEEYWPGPLSHLRQLGYILYGESEGRRNTDLFLYHISDSWGTFSMERVKEGGILTCSSITSQTVGVHSLWREWKEGGILTCSSITSQTVGVHSLWREWRKEEYWPVPLSHLRQLGYILYGESEGRGTTDLFLYHISDRSSYSWSTSSMEWEREKGGGLLTCSSITSQTGPPTVGTHPLWSERVKEEGILTWSSITPQTGLPTVGVHPLRVDLALRVCCVLLAFSVWFHVVTRVLPRLTHRARPAHRNNTWWYISNGMSILAVCGTGTNKNEVYCFMYKISHCTWTRTGKNGLCTHYSGPETVSGGAFQLYFNGF